MRTDLGVPTGDGSQSSGTRPWHYEEEHVVKSSDDEFKIRLGSFLANRMDAALVRASSTSNRPRVLARRKARWHARLGVSMAVVLAALVAIGVVARLQPVRLTSSSVVALGGVRIQATSATDGILTSETLPNWVAELALRAHWPPGDGNPPVRGLQVTGGFYVAGARTVKIDGTSAYSSTGPQNLWVVVVSGPPQGGWESVVGSAVINAASRRVMALQLLESNPSPGHSSPSA